MIHFQLNNFENTKIKMICSVIKSLPFLPGKGKDLSSCFDGPIVFVFLTDVGTNLRWTLHRFPDGPFLYLRGIHIQWLIFEIHQHLWFGVGCVWSRLQVRKPNYVLPLNFGPILPSVKKKVIAVSNFVYSSFYLFSWGGGLSSFAVSFRSMSHTFSQKMFPVFCGLCLLCHGWLVMRCYSCSVLHELSESTILLENVIFLQRNLSLSLDKWFVI